MEEISEFSMFIITGFSSILTFMFSIFLFGVSLYNSVLITITLIVCIPTIWLIIKSKKDEEPKKDERTEKIKGHSSYYAIIITLVLIMAIVWIDVVSNIIADQTRHILQIIGTFLVISCIACFWFINKKGDVE